MKISYLFVFICLLTTCTKEEACLYRLEGDWLLSSTQLWANGVEVVDTSTVLDSLDYTTTVVFSAYDDDLDEGNMSKIYLVTYTDSLDKRTTISSRVEIERYVVNSSCTQITLEGKSDTTTLDNTILTIKELTKKTLVYEYIIDEDSIKYKYLETLDKK